MILTSPSSQEEPPFSLSIQEEVLSIATQSCKPRIEPEHRRFEELLKYLTRIGNREMMETNSSRRVES